MTTEAHAVTTKLVLGPLAYNWSTERRLDLYRRIAAEAPVDEVVLGEVVCAKRSPFVRDATAEAAEILAAAGKTPVFATLPMAVEPFERSDVGAVCALADEGMAVEANDAGALLHLRGRAHRVGGFVNVYNAGTLRVLAADGATSVALPWELGRDTVAALQPVAQGLGIGLDVQVFGRVPLALSARCAHARAYGLGKDGCQYVCGRDEEGLSVDTLDGDAFLRVNGTQTMSHGVEVLVAEALDLAALGVARLRLAPEAVDMVAVATLYRDLLDGRREAGAVTEALTDLLGPRKAENGFHHGRTGAEWVAAAS